MALRSCCWQHTERPLGAACMPSLLAQAVSHIAQAALQHALPAQWVPHLRWVGETPWACSCLAMMAGSSLVQISQVCCKNSCKGAVLCFPAAGSLAMWRPSACISVTSCKGVVLYIGCRSASTGQAAAWAFLSSSPLSHDRSYHVSCLQDSLRCMIWQFADGAARLGPRVLLPLH